MAVPRIPLETDGQITAGREAGWTVRVEPAGHGACYVLLTREDEGYDYWVQDEDLAGFFEESGWEVSWGASLADPPGAGGPSHAAPPAAEAG